MSAPFVHLHVHSEYSLLSATSRVTQLVERASKLGQPAIALTDLDVMHGAVELQRACGDHKIKAVHGLDLGLVRRFPPERAGDDPARLVLLAETDEGLRNLHRLSSIAHLEGSDGRRVVVEEPRLAEFATGLIALTGSRHTRVGRHLIRGETTEARSHLQELLGIFGPANLFLQLERSGRPGSERVTWGVLGLARESATALVATADVRYLRPEDQLAFLAAVAIRQRSTVDEVREEIGSDERCLKSTEDMAAAYALFPDALEQSLAIADRCTGRIALGRQHPPRFSTPDGEPEARSLRSLAEQGLHDRYGHSPPAGARDRLEFELAAIEDRHADFYFLILWDLVRFSRLNEIPVGPGRGSAASSLVNYCLSVTDVDPLANGLYFERFFPLRWDGLPDVDIDFGVEDRHRVIEHLVQRHGADRVAHVVTFERRYPSRAVREAATVLGHACCTGARLAEQVPAPVWGRALRLEEYIANEPELRRLRAEDRDARAILDTAVGIQGIVHSRHTHAAAIAIGDQPLTERVPLQALDQERRSDARGIQPVSQYSLRSLERTGVLTLDVLGLDALDLTKAVLNEVEASTGARPDLASISLQDEHVLAMLCRGETRGVFSLESDDSREALRVLSADRFHDLALVIALVRPTALSVLGRCVRNKAQPDDVELPHEHMRPILADTYGVIVYQEQIMRLLVELSGFTPREADAARRALAKKHRDRIARARDRFASGALAMAMDASAVERVWIDWIEEPIDYAFNLAHALSYALISYRLAWLKQHFGGEFLAAMEEQERHRDG